MKWFAKTSMGEFTTDKGEKFISATLKDGESVEDILDWYVDQWAAEDITDIEDVYIYIMPWHPTTYKAHSDPETSEIIWEPC